MSTYALDNEKEAERLEKMSKMSAYLPHEELYKINFYPGKKILDAGCGSGVIARYIADNHSGVIVDACDLSADRIEQAKNIRLAEGKNDINFFKSDLDNINVNDNSYDTIICRYVFDFLPDPLKVLYEFKRILKQGGDLLIIQFDGVIFNLNHNNSKLMVAMEQLGKNLKIDMYFGRKIPTLMVRGGFSDVDWDVRAYGFKNQDLYAEQSQLFERFNFALPVLSNALGSHAEAIEFRDCYCNEMLKTDTVLFYNKFIVHGKNI